MSKMLIICIAFIVLQITPAIAGQDGDGGGLGHQYFIKISRDLFQEIEENDSAKDLLKANGVNLSQLKVAAEPHNVKPVAGPLLDNLGNLVDAKITPSRGPVSPIVIDYVQWSSYANNSSDARSLVLKELLRAANYNEGNFAAKFSLDVVAVLQGSNTFSNIPAGRSFIEYPNGCRDYVYHHPSKKVVLIPNKYTKCDKESLTYTYNSKTNLYEYVVSEFEYKKTIKFDSDDLIFTISNPVHSTNSVRLIIKYEESIPCIVDSGRNICVGQYIRDRGNSNENEEVIRISQISKISDQYSFDFESAGDVISYRNKIGSITDKRLIRSLANYIFVITTYGHCFQDVCVGQKIKTHNRYVDGYRDGVVLWVDELKYVLAAFYYFNEILSPAQYEIIKESKND